MAANKKNTVRHHFACGKCSKSWSMDEWSPALSMRCQHCGIEGKINSKGVSNGNVK